MITVGSFGFAFEGKRLNRIIENVAAESESATTKLHMSYG